VHTEGKVVVAAVKGGDGNEEQKESKGEGKNVYWPHKDFRF